MKNWTNLNVNKKTMIENYKIAIFDKDIKNIQLNTSDFICNNHASLLFRNMFNYSRRKFSIIIVLITPK